MPLTKQQAIASIMTTVSDSGLTAADIQQVISDLRNHIAVTTKSALVVGASVYVVQKTKKTLGQIIKINKTRCLVSMNGSKYNVPMSMIQVI